MDVGCNVDRDMSAEHEIRMGLALSLQHFFSFSPPKPDAKPHRESGEQSAGGKKDHRPKGGANVVKGAERGTRVAGWSTKSALFSC